MIKQIKVINDAHKIIKMRPQMYLGAEDATVQNLSEGLVSDARILSITKSNQIHVAGWQFVECSKDWLSENYNSFSFKDLFYKFCPFPEAGQNSIRSEVLVGTFCNDVIVISGTDINLIKGALPDKETIEKYFDSRLFSFAVGFRL